MEQTYWLKRKRSALAKARTATTAEGRLFHYDLAGRHSVRAADAAPPPTDHEGDGLSSNPQGDKSETAVAAPRPVRRKGIWLNA